MVWAIAVTTYSIFHLVEVIIAGRQGRGGRGAIVLVGVGSLLLMAGGWSYLILERSEIFFVARIVYEVLRVIAAIAGAVLINYGVYLTEKGLVGGPNYNLRLVRVVVAIIVVFAVRNF